MNGGLIEGLSSNLANNLRYQRTQRNMTQARLAELCDIPRSTLANLESGGGNPTLAVIGKLAIALQISIEELLSTPRAQCQLFRRGTLPIRQRDGGRCEVLKLLPDPIPGMEIDRLKLKPGSRFKGVPHRPGTREYLYCEAGALVLWAAGERFELRAGDVAAFQGDQPHSYEAQDTGATAFSVVTLAPIRS